MKGFVLLSFVGLAGVLISLSLGLISLRLSNERGMM